MEQALQRNRHINEVEGERDHLAWAVMLAFGEPQRRRLCWAHSPIATTKRFSVISMHTALLLRMCQSQAVSQRADNLTQTRETLYVHYWHCWPLFCSCPGVRNVQQDPPLACLLEPSLHCSTLLGERVAISTTDHLDIQILSLYITVINLCTWGYIYRGGVASEKERKVSKCEWTMQFRFLLLDIIFYGQWGEI